MTKRDELIALDPAGLEAAVRECARITAPEISDVEYERIKAGNSPRYQKTRAEMERALRAYLNAARSDAPGGVGAKVRELEWVEMPDRDPESASWIAETDLGRSYRVFAAWWGAQNKYGYVFDGFYHTENEAKAAAQADYERRILSALEAPAAGDGEPVAWRWQGESWGDYWIYNPEPGWLAEQNNIVKQPLYTAPPADAGMREALDAEERYLLEHFGSDADIMPGDIEGAFHRLRETLTAPGATTKSDGGVIAEMIDIASGSYGGHGETLDPWTADNRSTIDGWISRLRQPGPSDPSSTRSEVTVEELADWLFANLRPDTEPRQDARALLDQFEIRRK